MSRATFVTLIFLSLTVFGIGINSDRFRDNLTRAYEKEIDQERAVDILKPVVWAMANDESGITMRRICESGIKQRTPQGIAYVFCRYGDDHANISMEGRFYSDDVPVIMAKFAMISDGKVWKGPDPLDRTEPKYELVKHGPPFSR